MCQTKLNPNEQIFRLTTLNNNEQKVSVVFVLFQWLTRRCQNRMFYISLKIQKKRFDTNFSSINKECKFENQTSLYTFLCNSIHVYSSGIKLKWTLANRDITTQIKRKLIILQKYCAMVQPPLTFTTVTQACSGTVLGAWGVFRHSAGGRLADPTVPSIMVEIESTWMEECDFFKKWKPANSHRLCSF